jgi:UDP-2,3-diacylglucosamine pyrophosphatase LpxH
MILVVSDVHLGFDKCNRDEFLDFLNKYQGTEIDHLVLLGDIFDFWRCNNAEVVEKNDAIMVKINDLNAKNIHYIAGNHDYYLLDLNKRYTYPFIVSKYLRLEEGGKSFFFIHGHELEAILWEFPASLEIYEKLSNQMCFNKDSAGQILSRIWDIKGLLNKRRFRKDMYKEPNQRKNIDKVYNFAVSSGKYFLLGMKPDENLVFGHTHRPFINQDKTVVNTGSWVDELPSKDYQNSYVEISEGQMELKFF